MQPVNAGCIARRLLTFYKIAEVLAPDKDVVVVVYPTLHGYSYLVGREVPHAGQVRRMQDHYRIELDREIAEGPAADFWDTILHELAHVVLHELPPDGRTIAQEQTRFANEAEERAAREVTLRLEAEAIVQAREWLELLQRVGWVLE